MKTGIVISGLAHGAIVAFAVVSIGAPRPLDVEQVDALPIEIVTLSELTKSIEGAVDATPDEPPAPEPVEQEPEPEPEPEEDIGETQQDVDVTTAEDTPTEPTPEPEVVEAPDPEPQTEPVAVPQPDVAEPAEPTDIAALAEEALTQEVEPEETVELPENIPVPKPRPQRQTALLDKSEPTTSGTRSAQQPAGLGVRRGNSDTELSTSEKDALVAQIKQCFNPGALAGSADAAQLRAKVVFKMTPNGELDGRPTASATGSDATTNRTMEGAARRAVLRCAPYDMPAEKYDNWAAVTANFDLSDML